MKTISLLVLALLASSAYAQKRDLLTKIKVTNTKFSDVPVYDESSDGPTGVTVDVSSATGFPPKKDKYWGVDAWKEIPWNRATAIGLAPDATNEVKVRAVASANTKFAPAKAIATAYGENGGSGNVLVLAQARANGKPGPQYGVLSTYSDATGISAGKVNEAGVVTVLSTSRATGGQGETVSGAYARGSSATGAFVTSDARANSAKWYMAPGNSVAGAKTLGTGGHVGLRTVSRARADLGTATSGILSVAKSNGVQPIWFDALPAGGNSLDAYDNIIYTITDNDPRADAGASIGGTVNIGSAAAGKVVLLNDNMESSAAVGEALAGLINVAFANDGDVLIGDYDNSDATQNEVISKVRGRGDAQGGMINIGIAPNGQSEITGNLVVAADQGSAIAGGFSLSNAYNKASNDISVTSSTSEYASVAGLVGVTQSQEQAQNTLASSAKSNIGPALSYTIANSALGEIAVTTGSSSATTVTGQAASMALSQSIGGVTTESQAASTATTKDGNAVSVGNAISASAFTAEAVSTSSATTTNGAAVSGSAALAFAADSEADSASSSAASLGNVASVSGALATGVIQGKANSASSAATETGSVGSVSMAGSTGVIQAQAKVSSSAQTADGNAQSLAGAISVAGINSVSSAKSTSAAQTGDVDSMAESYGLGGFHGEANADSASATGCDICDSTSTAIAVATGAIADATARSKADSPKNPGQAIANAMALGGVSRTSNGGQARVAIGPAQALTGGFAVSAPRQVVNEVNKAAASAMDPSKAKAGAAMKDAVSKGLGSLLPKPIKKEERREKAHA